MKPFIKRLALVMGLLFMALSGFALEAANDESNLGKIDPEAFSQRAVTELSSSVQGADFADLPPREFAIPVLLPAQSYLPPLLVPVVGIISGSPQKQMGWIGAGRIVTRMKHLQSIRDRSIVDEPRTAMRFDYFAAKTDIPIPSRDRTEPPPASAKAGVMGMKGAIFRHFRPETVWKGDGKAWSQQHRVSQLLEAVTI